MRRKSHLIYPHQTNQEPVMVHGTSTYAVIEMLETGYLPSSFHYGQSDHVKDNGYMFFVPGKEAFFGHPLYDRICISLHGEALENKVREYAQNTQGRRYLSELLGKWPPLCNCDEFEPFGFWSLEQLEAEGVDTGLMEAIGLDILYGFVMSLSGVCIGVNEDIFELCIEEGCDEPGEEVMVYLPDGLDVKYVEYVKPFGGYEHTVLDEFLQGGQLP